MPDDYPVRPAQPADPGLVRDALAGLRADPKWLPAKLFYDEEGCGLFYKITELPEYYLTRTELGLLRAIAPAIAAQFGAPAALIEYGASDETKAGFLLDQVRADRTPVFAAYVPVDVAATALRAMRARLARRRPALRVWPIVADFLGPVRLPHETEGMARLGFFPGSTIGNLDPDQAVDFLAGARRMLGQGARMLVGADVKKDPAILIPAYDDAAGVTAAFNRNILARLNREAGADFDLSSFEHRALWNDAAGRIEMHLVSRRAQVAHVDGEPIHFAAGETIHTENSYKYTQDGFRALAGAAGWHSPQMWTDRDGLFSLHLLEDGG
ncbi:MAG TPA: L-histidine N(alpha)-methyltransferase [Acetobacteraceae bacterium]|nr:L-histidine N(alpha)-methyltransferase [Acetobacteraceae bacterium]